MSDASDWQVPQGLRPRAGSLGYDLDAALASVVGLTAHVPEDAFTAETLGTERVGSGVVIREDVVLTIGYLVTEAEQVWLTTASGRVVPGAAIGFDFETGFGFVQALGSLGAPPIALGRSADLELGAPVVLAGAGGREGALAAEVVARQEFAGYWEYRLDEALFTAPGHPHWGGTALIGPGGRLVGVGSLQLAGARPGGKPEPINMSVPIDLLPPILDDMLSLGRTSRPPRPWLGAFFADTDEGVVVMGVSKTGPASRAGLARGDVVRALGGGDVADLSDLYRRMWALGEAGVSVPLTIEREGDVFDVDVRSGDRRRFLKAPRLH
jgi:S1-C subfamily serine protease